MAQTARVTPAYALRARPLVRNPCSGTVFGGVCAMLSFYFVFSLPTDCARSCRSLTVSALLQFPPPPSRKNGEEWQMWSTATSCSPLHFPPPRPPPRATPTAASQTRRRRTGRESCRWCRCVPRKHDAFIPCSFQLTSESSKPLKIPHRKSPAKDAPATDTRGLSCFN